MHEGTSQDHSASIGNWIFEIGIYLKFLFMIDPADIIEICKTKHDIDTFQAEITQLGDGLFNNKAFEVIASEALSYEKKERIFALFTKHTIDTKNISQVQFFLSEIKETIQALPLISLTLAFAPKQQLVSNISSWFIFQVKKPVLLDIQVNTTLLGGAIVTYNGVYKDYSLKKIFEEKYQKGDIRL